MTQLTDANYVSKAEQAIKKLNRKNGKFELTMSQIRNLLALTSAIYTDAQVLEFRELQDQLSYLKVQFIYQSGRKDSVKDFVNKADIISLFDQITNTRELIRFCRYMEALVAYFRYEGGSKE